MEEKKKEKSTHAYEFTNLLIFFFDKICLKYLPVGSYENVFNTNRPVQCCRPGQ